MRPYIVRQMLVRERVIRVNADSKQEAERFAKDGLGTVLSYGGNPQLLSSNVEREGRTRQATVRG